MNKKDRFSYHYKAGRSHPKVSAEVCGKELERIRAKHGYLTAEATFEESIPGTAVLHESFEWDKEKGWREHNLSLARNIINVVHVGVKGQPRNVTVQQFQFVDRKNTGREYLPVAEIMSDDVLRQRAFDECLKELLAVRDKYRSLHAFAGIWQKVDELVDTIN